MVFEAIADFGVVEEERQQRSTQVHPAPLFLEAIEVVDVEEGAEELKNETFPHKESRVGIAELEEVPDEALAVKKDLHERIEEALEALLVFKAIKFIKLGKGVGIIIMERREIGKGEGRTRSCSSR